MTSRRQPGSFRSMQRVIVLAGLPGSGKSTLAQRLHAVGWIWVNQDVLGSRRACEDAVTAALAAGAEVVVDRCNFDEQQRLTWLALARRFRAVPIGLQLLVPVEECIRRVCLRTDHPTLAAGNAPEVIARFAHDFRPFHRHEGFAEVHVACCQPDVEAFLMRVGPARQHAPVATPGGPRQPYAPLGPAMPAFRPVCGGVNHAAQHTGCVGVRAAAQQESAVGTAAFAAFTGPPLSRSATPGQGWRRTVPLMAMDQPTMSMRQLSPHPALTPAAMQGAGTGMQQEEQQSNAVPFPGGRGRAAQGAPAAGSSGNGSQHRFLDEGTTDSRPILLFDLNGTLTSHTAARRSAGVNLMRPGIHHLMRLHDTFRIGIFSSASQRTVSTVIPMLEAAARSGSVAKKVGTECSKLLPERAIVLTRQHTEAAPKEHTVNGGKAWDTVKPLSKWFRNLARVILVDDDAYKAVLGEEHNMILVPRWEETQDDITLEALVDALLEVMGSVGASEDVRLHTKTVQQNIVMAAAAAGRVVTAAPNSEEVELAEEDADLDAELENTTRQDGLFSKVAQKQQRMGLVMA